MAAWRPAGTPAAAQAWLVGLVEALLGLAAECGAGEGEGEGAGAAARGDAAPGGPPICRRIATREWLVLLRPAAPPGALPGASPGSPPRGQPGGRLWLVAAVPRAAVRGHPGREAACAAALADLCDAAGTLGGALPGAPGPGGPGAGRPPPPALGPSLDLLLARLAQACASGTGGPGVGRVLGRGVPFHSPGRSEFLLARQLANSLVCGGRSGCRACLVGRAGGLVWSDFGREATVGLFKLLALHVLSRVEAGTGPGAGPGAGAGAAVTGGPGAPPLSEAPAAAAAAAAAERLLSPGSRLTILESGFVAHPDDAVAAGVPLAPLAEVRPDGVPHRMYCVSMRGLAVALFADAARPAPTPEDLAWAAAEVAGSALLSLDQAGGGAPGNTAPGVRCWSLDLSTHGCCASENASLGSAPPGVQQKLLQVQASFRREGPRLREVFLRPKRAGWIAGRRVGRRELYMHIPHADTLLEASRLARGAAESPAGDRGGGSDR